MFHHWVLSNENTKKIEKYLEDGLISIGDVNFNGHNVLFVAETPEMVEFLVGKCVDLEFLSPLKTTPLTHAIEIEENDEAILKMLDLGARTDGVDIHGDNIWHKLAQGDASEEVWERVASRNPKGINTPNRSGWLPLAIAVQNQAYESVKKLLANGAIVDLDHIDKYSPVKLASFSDPAILSILMQHWIKNEKSRQDLPVLGSSSGSSSSPASSSSEYEVSEEDEMIKMSSTFSVLLIKPPTSCTCSQKSLHLCMKYGTPTHFDSQGSDVCIECLKKVKTMAERGG